MKRLAALLFALSVLSAFVSGASPARATDVNLTGVVSSPNGTVASGQIEFYATCGDYDAYNPAASGDIVDGTYYATVPTGTYKVLIKPTAGQGAARGWHSAQAECADATAITVNNSTPINLTALAGSNVTGTVSSANGQVHSAFVYFYKTCRDFRNYDEAAYSALSLNTYTVTVPNGDYLVQVDPSGLESALTSWHNNKATCATADVVTVNGNATKNLTIRAGTRLSGAVTSGHGPVTQGSLYLYPSCQAYEDGTGSVYASINNGSYSATIAPGTYRVQIYVYDDSGAMSSWNGGSTDCTGSTGIDVTGTTDTADLLSKTGVILTGSVTSSRGPVAIGYVDFYADCNAYENRNEAGGGYVDSGTYTAVLEPSTDYVALIRPASGSGAVDAWHSDKVACGDAEVIHVGAVGVDPQDQPLVARAGSTITGSVTSSNGPVTSGQVDFYATCAAANDGLSSAGTSIDNGQYSIDLPAGTYRVYITPDDGERAVESWHNAKATCGKATVVTVSGNGTVDLVATPGSLISGTVTSSRGTIAQGGLDFYTTCEDFEDGDRTASGYFSNGDPYQVTLPNGTYRVQVRPSSDEPAVRSWHSNAMDCADSTKVTVSGNGTINLVFAGGYPVSGDVSSVNGAVRDGEVSFYASCEDYRHYRYTMYAGIDSGSFATTLPNGTYRIAITPASGTGAVNSWHNDKPTCAQADTITVNAQINNLHLVADGGYEVSGGVWQGGTQREYGQVSFYRTCEDYANDDPVASSWLGYSAYEVQLPPGDYKVGVEFGRYESRVFLWHNGETDCASADPVSISGDTDSADITVPATSKITGGVSAGGDPVRSGWLEFFTTCQNYTAGLRAATTNFSRGEYLAYVAAGTYYVRVHPDAGAATSWHSAAANCGTPISVSGAGTIDLVAAKGVVVTGTVSSTNGPVESGHIDFAPSCAAWEAYDYTYMSFTDTYQVNLLPGTYVAFIDTDTGTGGRDSWHSAQATCASAATITVGADATVNLLVRPKLGDPVDPTPPPVNPTPPPPAQPAAQTLKKPPAKLKKGKKVTLAKKTRQGAKVTWKTTTKKICTVKKNVVTAKKKGKCKVSAKAPAVTGYTAFSKRYVIIVK